MSRPAVVVVLAGLMLAIGCGPAMTPGGGDLGDHATRVPEPYATMLDDGRAVEVLRGLESMWSEGVADDTIEAVRARAVDAVVRAGSFSTGDETTSVDDLREVAEWLAATPDVLAFRVEVAGDLAPQRLVALAVAEGRAHRDPPASESSVWVLPEIDLADAIDRSDPWLVSAALFLARKQNVELDAAAVVARWTGPKPWDDECSTQALLFLARDAYSGDDSGWRADPRLVHELATIGPATPGEIEILPWAFVASDRWASTLEPYEPSAAPTVVTRDSTMDPIGRHPAVLDGMTLILPATRNFLELEIDDGARTGVSRSVQGTGGTFVRLAIPVR
ncbi:MAG: hypothetical protein AB1Z65_03540 [Candidatus Sulfomarinibacteraceae bacterium]